MSLRHLLSSISAIHKLVVSNTQLLSVEPTTARASVSALQSLRAFHSSALQPGAAKLPLLPHTCAADNMQSMQMAQVRYMSKLKPKFTGGKLKPFSSFSERFKVTGSGLIVFKRPGHRHKRFSKGPHRNRHLRRTQVLTSAYTITMKKLGFVSRNY